MTTSIKNPAAKRVSQREVTRRIYNLRKQLWHRDNVEEVTDGRYEFNNGVRCEFSITENVFKPFWMFKKFDSAVTIHYSIKKDVQSLCNPDEIKSVLKNEYMVVRGVKFS